MHVILIYIGILLGIFLEGEMIMISSVIAAHHNYLNLWIVVPVGAVGTYFSDLFYFYVGRKKGKEWLNRNSAWSRKADIIDSKIKKYPVIIFVTYRFLYGFRTVTPIAIGASKIKSTTFYLFSAFSTLIWTFTYSTIGYVFGEIIKSKLHHIEHIEKYIIGVIVLIGMAIIAIKFGIRQNVLHQPQPFDDDGK